jgi:hypothetical protein
LRWTEVIKSALEVVEVEGRVSNRIDEVSPLPFLPLMELVGIGVCMCTDGNVEGKGSDIEVKVPFKNLRVGEWSIHAPRIT